MENFNYEAFELIARCTQKDLQNYLAPQLEQIYGKDCTNAYNHFHNKGVFVYEYTKAPFFLFRR